VKQLDKVKDSITAD